ncbi:1,4-alpha-glucan (glycogen) branching enzyme, GH-13-type [Minicystis rosea]|nr:1,4-alpha-glucan (glycogen) branching enzyme, GH-13-type [Minicystis rosea]
MIPREELDRIAAVEHSDPHSVLGPHEEDGALVVRVFRPDALDVRLLRDDGSSVAMERVHGLGIFEARLPRPDPSRAAGRPLLRYRLEIRHPEGVEITHDPYAFTPSLGDLDLHLVAEGTHQEIYRRLGAHVREVDGVRGTGFAVWAPAAQRVSVTGDFTGWDGRLYAMRRMGLGIWEIFVPGVAEGALYKFEIKTLQGPLVLKSDPYGQAMELRPKTASKVVSRRYEFTDARWMADRAASDPRRKPISIYEVHLGSWRIKPKPEAVPGEPPPKGDPAERWYSYRELADILVDYVAEMGFTHVELLPVMEHPYDGSWGYQVSGYFAPTSRYGDPDDLRYFVDRCHARGLGVILDWTPAHFPKDAFALGRFDGSALYEHLDPRKGEHKHWNTFVFNYGRPEVKNFLIGNALYWIEEFHVDGLRVDAVASMLYLDYGASNPGEWVPNKYGGRENLEAVEFIRELNERVHARFPGVLMAAEESTSWPGVTKPSYVGGLGFDFKWNMGWMHDTLAYFSFDPIHRAFHHGKLTFGIWYAWSERYLLPLSHDEVVHLKKSLLSKMPGDRWKMHATLRALYAYMWAHPGKKLLFMGGEIGQYREWNFESELDWGLLAEPDHHGLSKLVRDLNERYRRYPALHQLDDEPEGFKWIDCNDAPHSVIAFVRFPSFLSPKGRRGRIVTKGLHVVVACNFTPIPRTGYRFGVPRRCAYREVLNTDARDYGGSGMGNLGRVEVEDVPQHGHPQSIVLTLPPLSVIFLVPELDEDPVGIEPPAVDLEATEAEVAEANLSDSAPDESARHRALLLAGLSPAAIAALAGISDVEVGDESTLVSLDRRKPKKP